MLMCSMKILLYRGIGKLCIIATKKFAATQDRLDGMNETP
jgi:hypothetical protein